MKKRIWLFAMLVVTALLLSGCAMRTVEELYALPKRSEEFRELQSAIDTAMYGLTYASPQSGENQQTVQMADLDGDGVEEFLVFAKGATEKPLQVLIFQQDENGKVRTMETMGFNGLTFEQVEYVEFDDYPGCELVVGFQVGDQVLRSVAVYTFRNGDAKMLLLNGYSKFLTCDLDQNNRIELMVFRPGEAQTESGMAVCYSYQGKSIERSVETGLSEPISHIRRIMPATLQDGTSAVFVASSVDDNAIVTDIFTLKEGRLTNISFSAEANTSISTLRNFYIYADDIDNDGVMELPNLITMKPVTFWQDETQKYLLRWFSLDQNGWETDKLYTFHNFLGGWYFRLNGDWASRVTVNQENDTYDFYIWDSSYLNATHLFSIYVLTGSDRDEASVQDGRFALYRAEGVAYAAELQPEAEKYEITEQYLIEGFQLIRQDWHTGET